MIIRKFLAKLSYKKRFLQLVPYLTYKNTDYDVLKQYKETIICFKAYFQM